MIDHRPTIVSRWREWAPAILLIAVAVAQVTLAKTAALSPWKGGGFGMFSTTDGTAFRRVRIFVEAPGRSEEIKVSPSFAREATKAEVFPSDALLKRLARHVAARERREGRPVSMVRLEVWRTEFNRSLRATDRRLREFSFRVASGPGQSR